MNPLHRSSDSDRYDSCYRHRTGPILIPPSQGARSLVATLEFVLWVVTHGEEYLRALEAGVLDIILRIYVVFPSFSQSAIDGPESWQALLITCRSLLLRLSQQPLRRNEVIYHPVSILWTDCCPVPPSYSWEPRGFGSDLAERCLAWRRADRTCVKRRVTSIYIGCLWRKNVYEIEDLEGCGDLVEFVRYDLYETNMILKEAHYTTDPMSITRRLSILPSLRS